MLLTVPILYYKPIQEQALKIKAGRKDRREEKWWGGREGDREQEGTARDLRVQKQYCFIHV